MEKCKIRLNGFEALTAKVQEKSQEDFLACSRRAVLLLRVNARKHTPVAKSTAQHTGGSLRQSLRVQMPSVGTPGIVGYTVHYAPHVEYGHRQQPGRFVPQIGKRLKASYVPGQYFLKTAVEETRPEFYQDLKETLKK